MMLRMAESGRPYSSKRHTHTGRGCCVMGCHPVLEGFDSGISMHVELCVCVSLAGRQQVQKVEYIKHQEQS